MAITPNLTNGLSQPSRKRARAKAATAVAERVSKKIFEKQFQQTLSKSFSKHNFEKIAPAECVTICDGVRTVALALAKATVTTHEGHQTIE